MKKVLFSSIAALGLFYSSEAMAQPSAPSPGTPPKCEDVPDCMKARKELGECKSDLEISKKSYDLLSPICKQQFDENKGKVGNTPPPPPKPVRIKCLNEVIKDGKTIVYGGIESDGKGGCECTEPDTYVAIPKISFQSMVCVPHAEAFRVLKMEVEALKKPGLDTSDLENRIKLGVKEEYSSIKSEVEGLKGRLDAAEAKLQDHEPRITALEDHPGTLADSGVGVQGGLLATSGVGLAGYIAGVYRQTLYFGHESIFGIVLELGAGGSFSSEDRNGPEFILKAGTGVRVDFTPDRVFSGTLTVQGMQFISTEGAGYKGTHSTLEDPGMGYMVAPQVELDMEPVPYFRVGLIGSVGYAQRNYWEKGYLKFAEGVGGVLGVNLTLHTDYGTK